jgi:hypothetical protein
VTLRGVPACVRETTVREEFVPRAQWLLWPAR